MGIVFGKETVAEPAFEILMKRVGHNVRTNYELRQYGERFAAEVNYQGGNGENSPFSTLAKYIGVFGTPENEGNQAIDMTAPVVMQSADQGGTKIAMTAPVAMEQNQANGERTMKFFLPAEYDDWSKIPKPTNPSVHIEEIPSQTGVVHQFSGSMSEDTNREIAMSMAEQLMDDGVERISVDYVLDHYQFWGYNPPFTLPMFRRNEIWLELDQSQVQQLMEKYSTETSS